MWQRMTDLPAIRYEHSCATIDGKLYIIGGTSSDPDDVRMWAGTGPKSTVMRFDPVANEWEDLPDMLHERIHFAVAVLDDKLYVFGGFGR